MKMTSVPGTVQAFFFFRDNTCEIDMESVSRIQNPWQSYLTVQPQIYNEDGSASNLTNIKYTIDFDPTTVSCLRKRDHFNAETQPFLFTHHAGFP